MLILTGRSASALPRGWWRPTQQRTIRRQHIIHYLKPFTGTGQFFLQHPSYLRWVQGGQNALSDSLNLLADDDPMWDYIVDAQVADANGTSNTRIFTIPLASWQDPHSWQRFVAEVHYRFLTAQTLETVVLVLLEDCLAAGLPVLDHDVNVWGNSGFMFTWYDPTTDRPNRREMYGWHETTARIREARLQLTLAYRFARQYGRVIQPAYPDIFANR